MVHYDRSSFHRYTLTYPTVQKLVSKIDILNNNKKIFLNYFFKGINDFF